MGFFRKELLYVIVIIFGSMNFGETMAYWSPANKQMTADLQISDFAGTVFNTLPAFMGIITPFFIHIPINKLGRRLTSCITGISAVVGWLLIPIANEKLWIFAFIGRTILGLTVGSFSTVCPLYITEISPTEVRGSYGILHQFGVVIGACLCYLLGIWINWRYLALILALQPFIHVVFIYCVPESPHQDHEEIPGSKKESLFSKKFIKPILVSSLLMFFQQFSGCNGFLSNLEKIFSDAGSSIRPSVAAFLVGLSGLVATGFSAPLVACIGHRPAWHISSVCCALALLIAALNYWFNWSKVIPAIMMILDNLMFGFGLGPIPWVITPELFPDSVRPVATSIMTTLNWTFAAIVMMIWPPMSKYLKFGVSMAIYAGICFAAFGWGIFMLPDTHGKEMGAIFEEKAEPLLSNN
ncbi:major facilitator superfamily protein [Trichomonas vaginalis G3]|uniref:Major facilitator superfamily protein n=1 Tax=Trichomonas vaginalis (strain ATCC PRA-98 / G3) TaxID=412133 RepID=A2G249_TRIV3|nr:major facilitator superfamily transporter [Trichomonas vaginalis G3]EAX88772.1 major facilitator superfamily protein [Trichomonas vaginalis G3]KAI5532878.1 glucose import [Trichomonas vaginalis G3]|eukprot:XP_001301702.1 major facilitator superfamily transporter [Trichomonas vaginalis G3]